MTDSEDHKAEIIIGNSVKIKINVNFVFEGAIIRFLTSGMDTSYGPGCFNNHIVGNLTLAFSILS